MIICDLCKQDPLAGEKNEALKAQPWGLTITPPPGSGLPERRFCLPCTIKIVDTWIALAQAPAAAKKAN